jgi:hypothetical protein
VVVVTCVVGQLEFNWRCEILMSECEDEGAVCVLREVDFFFSQ